MSLPRVVQIFECVSLSYRQKFYLDKIKCDHNILLRKSEPYLTEASFTGNVFSVDRVFHDWFEWKFTFHMSTRHRRGEIKKRLYRGLNQKTAK